MRHAQAQVRLGLSMLSDLMFTALRVWAGLSSFVCHANHRPLRRYLLGSPISVRMDCSISDEIPSIQAMSFSSFATRPSAKSTVSCTTLPACSICGTGGDSARVGVGTILPGSVPDIESVLHAPSIRRHHLISGWYRAQLVCVRGLARRMHHGPVPSAGTR